MNCRFESGELPQLPVPHPPDIPPAIPRFPKHPDAAVSVNNAKHT